MTTMENSALLEKIEALDVKEAWKQKFRLYAEAGIKGGGFFPTIENKSILKGQLPAKYNIFGFLFGPFYYIALGLYKKAGMIFLFYGVMKFLIGLVGALIQGIGYPITHLFLFIFILFYIYFIFFYFPIMVNYDYYRKQVLNENFWW